MTKSIIPRLDNKISVPCLKISSSKTVIALKKKMTFQAGNSPVHNLHTKKFPKKCNLLHQKRKTLQRKKESWSIDAAANSSLKNGNRERNKRRKALWRWRSLQTKLKNQKWIQSSYEISHLTSLDIQFKSNSWTQRSLLSLWSSQNIDVTKGLNLVNKLKFRI